MKVRFRDNLKKPPMSVPPELKEQGQTYAKLMLRSWGSLGLTVGTKVLLTFLSNQELMEIKLPQYRHPIFVRGGTSDRETFEKIFITEEYDSFIEEAKVIVDLGANAGYASVFFANRYPEAKILAVEPEASNFELLKRNTRPYPNITPIQAAIWPSKKTLKIIDENEEKWLFQVTESEDTSESNGLESVTMPELLAMVDQQPIDILKIDIESAEKELFATGYESWLGKVGMIIIEFHDRLRSGCSQSFYRALTHYEFNSFVKGENVFVLLRSQAS